MVPTTVVVNGSIGNLKNQPITLPAGNTLTLNIPISYPDGSNPNLTGATAQWWLSQGVYVGASVVPIPGAPVVLKKDTSLNGATLALVANVWTLTVHLDASNTASLVAGTYYYEAEITDALGVVAAVAFGRFSLLATLIHEGVPGSSDVGVYTQGQVDNLLAARDANAMIQALIFG